VGIGSADRWSGPVALLRAGRGMAIGALASRVTGFGRMVVMAAALGLGTQLLDSYTVANTIPTVAYQLVFGGVATSLIIPAVSRELQRDRAAGLDYAQRLLSVTVYGLAAVVIVAILAAPLLVEIYSPGLGGEQQRLAVVFARYFLPQILLFGIGATAAAVLNSLGGHSAPMWAPAANNVIVITVGLGYIAVGGGSELVDLSGRHVVLLGLGTTAGVAAQAGIICWVLRRQGFVFRLRRDIAGTGLGRIVRLGFWVVVTVVANQATYTIATRSASHLAPGAVSAFQTAYAIFHLPYAVVAVSVIVTVLPRLSRAAAGHDTHGLVTHLTQSLRAVCWVTAPAGAALVLLGPAISALLFSHGNSTADGVTLVGSTVRVFGLAVVPFAAYAVLMAVFNAMQDTRTAAAVDTVVAVVAVSGFMASLRFLPDGVGLVGIAAGYAAAYTVGCAVAGAVLYRRLAVRPAGMRAEQVER
jgi:putative peptidoglycan lipid II flippase